MTRSIRRKLTLAGLGVAGAVTLGVLGVAGSTAALAQDGTATPDASTSAEADHPRHHGRGGDQADREQRQDRLAQALADELGVDKQKVADALDKIAAQRQESRPDHDGQPSAESTPDDSATPE